MGRFNEILKAIGHAPQCFFEFLCALENLGEFLKSFEELRESLWASERLSAYGGTRLKCKALPYQKLKSYVQSSIKKTMFRCFFSADA